MDTHRVYEIAEGRVATTSISSLHRMWSELTDQMFDTPVSEQTEEDLYMLERAVTLIENAIDHFERAQMATNPDKAFSIFVDMTR